MTTLLSAAWLALIVAGEPTNGPQAPQSQSPPRTGVIVGRVVDAAAGTPVSGVLVTAIPSGFSGGDDRPQAIVADSQGRFAFRNLAKGSYTLLANVGGNGFSPSGFLVSGRGHQIGAYLNGGYGQRRPDGPLQPIELAEGGRVADAVVALWKGGAISGYVIDEAGEPLVDLVVAAVRRNLDGRLLTGPSTRTDDRGAYRIGTLLPGDYLVVVPQTQVLLPSSTIERVLANAPDAAATARFAVTGAPAPPQPTATGSPVQAGLKVGSSVMAPAPPVHVTNALMPARRDDRLHAYQTTFFPSATASGGATSILVRSGEDRPDVNIQLQPARTVEVSGTLLDDTGPVANFGIHLMPATSGDGSAVLEVATAATDAGGGFRFPLVPSSTYTLVAQRSAQAPSGGAVAAGSTRMLSEQAGAWARLPLSVGDDNISNVVVTLRRGLQISGRVAFHGASDPPADRLKQLAVTLARSQPLFRSMESLPAGAVAPDGTFTIRGITPAAYLLLIRDLAPAWTVQSVAVGGEDVTDRSLPLSSDLENVVITLTDQPAHLGGKVSAPGLRATADKSGATSPPDPQASVFLFPADRERWTHARISTRVFRTVRASQDGTFNIANLIPGEYFVVAAPDHLAADWPDVTFLTKLAARAIRIRIDVNQKQTVTLQTVAIR